MVRRSMLWLCAVGLGACAAAPGAQPPAGGPPPSAPLSLAGTRWLGVVDSSTDANSVPRLEFVGGRVSGYTGCNMLSGTWRHEGDEVRFGAIATTKRMCLGPGADIEKRLLAAMGDASRVRKDGDRLVIEGPSGQRFEFTPAK